MKQYICFQFKSNFFFPSSEAYMLHSVSLIIVTIISRHIFTNISHMEHISAVKFYMGNENNMINLLIPKSQKVWIFFKIGPCIFNEILND